MTRGRRTKLTPMHMMGGWAPSRGDVTVARHVAQSLIPKETTPTTVSVDVVMPTPDQLDLFGMEGSA